MAAVIQKSSSGRMPYLSITPLFKKTCDIRLLILLAVVVLSGCDSKYEDVTLKQTIKNSSGSAVMAGRDAKVVHYITNNFYGTNAEEVQRLQDELKRSKDLSAVLMRMFVSTQRRKNICKPTKPSRKQMQQSRTAQINSTTCR